MVLSLLWWSYWWRCRGVRSARATAPPAGAARHTTKTTTALGLEDDPDQWHVWTALDERQLIRLLTESAPINRRSIDDAISHDKGTA